MRKIAYTLLLLLPFGISEAAAQQTARGCVYLDANANGKKDAKEKGMQGVAVSNGREVVTTDNKGRYELPVSDDAIIFVIKPSGYAVPLNADNQPKHYYIHKPKGSPKFEYPGSAPTGPLPASIDFALRPQQESNNFRALVFGDPQIYDDRELGYFDKGIVSEVAGVKDVAFGISLGDLAGKDLGYHKPYSKAVAKIGIPWYNVEGNHDMNNDAPVDSLADETFEANFGPNTYSYNYGNAHFIILDDNLFPDPRGHRRGLWAGFTGKQLEFIKNDLRLVDTGKLVVLAFHCSMYIVNENSFRKEDRNKLFDLLQHYPHVLALSAHSHNQRQHFYGKEEGWNGAARFHEFNVGATCGNWYSGRVNAQGVMESVMSDGTPRGYVYLNVTGNQYTADYKVAGKPADYQIGLYHRKVMSNIWWDGQGFIYANFFMGHKGSELECRIDNGDWKRMTYSEEGDPAFISELYKWDDSDSLFRGRRPTTYANSLHLWKMRLPENLGVGTHQIEVRATDPFGRKFLQKSSYRIEEPTF
ncbi:calcineurin-like phosphoesterase C-terminal domain-containing protein [Chitinophaga sp. 22620]|uniref:calcineurin-like phosphoesterase C-terminal domain-containing protein n=1 Tax=Chitinophaga sp. 22620 TaxID=3453952 RepID=UPI003F85BEF9